VHERLTLKRLVRLAKTEGLKMHAGLLGSDD
jgi:hypothetical protein